MRVRCGQVSIEFLIFVAISFVMAIVITSVALDQQQEKTSERNKVGVQDVANKIQEEIVIAQSVQSGFMRNFTLPEKLPSGNPYSIFQNSSYIRVVAEETEVEVNVPPYEGQVVMGANVICNRNGEVFVGTGCLS